AEMALGFLFYEGTVLPRDLAKAVAYFTSAAAKGAGEASFALATIYGGASDGQPDLVRAYAHFVLAKQAGIAMPPELEQGFTPYLSEEVVAQAQSMIETGALFRQ
ncbi:MAG: hypothetical protein AAGF19_06390, partial [Pseudomonadota bacterium]